jgi:F-type H+-transporting ATPase subunit delta
MITGSIARRYAKALFSLASDGGHVEGWNDSLQTLKRAIESSPDLQDVLSNPVYSKEQRRAIVEQLGTALKLAAEPTSLLYLLAERNRLGYLGTIVDRFRDLADAHLGRVRARVTSAVPLDAAAVQAIAERLVASAKATVVVERAVDPSLLGGVVAQVGSLVYDGSLRTQLDDLRKTLKQ